jgi:hypothetical protein
VRRVRKMKRFQDGMIGLQAAGVADAFQVGFEVEGIGMGRALRFCGCMFHVLMIND